MSYVVSWIKIKLNMHIPVSYVVSWIKIKLNTHFSVSCAVSWTWWWTRVTRWRARPGRAACRRAARPRAAVRQCWGCGLARPSGSGTCGRMPGTGADSPPSAVCCCISVRSGKQGSRGVGPFWGVGCGSGEWGGGRGWGIVIIVMLNVQVPRQTHHL